MTDMMKSSCHGKFNCSVEAEQNAVDLNLFTDPECYKPKQELSVEYICGNKSFFQPRILKFTFFFCEILTFYCKMIKATFGAVQSD